MLLLFLCLIGLLYQDNTNSKFQTRLDNYQLFILLHAYKQDNFTMKCAKCRHKNVIPLYADTSIFKYSKEIKAIYPILLSPKK